MERTRANLSKILKEVLGNNNTYFQPTTGTKMNYPCIIYKLGGLYNNRADDINYKLNKRYDITVVDKNPDSDIYERLIERFDNCSLDRTGVADNLHHWYLTLYW